MHSMWNLSIFVLCCGLVKAAYGEEETLPISDFIKEVPSPDYTLSISKDWALKFDEEVGRGDYLTKDKQDKVHNNLLEFAEILHIIPEGSASHYKELLLKDDHDYDHHDTSYKGDFPVSIPLLRRQLGISAYVNAAQQVNGHRNNDQSTVAPKLQTGDLNNRKYSPRLAMYSTKESQPSTEKNVVDERVQMASGSSLIELI